MYLLFRQEVNNGNYKEIEKCKSVATLTSAFKLFLRQLPTPIIERQMVELALSSNRASYRECSAIQLIADLKKSVALLPRVNYKSLHFILLHLKRVADNTENRMNSESLAIIFGQNLFPCKRGESLKIDGVLVETEQSNKLAEILITYVHDMFSDKLVE